MPDNPTTALVKAANSPALARVSNQLALTDKLLAKPEEPFLIPYRKGNKWGFCDRNKNIVIDCIWDWVEPFSSGLAATPHGYIGHDGSIVIGIDKFAGVDFKGMFSYNESGFPSFKKGIAGFKQLSSGRYGLMNKNGCMITPYKYNYIHHTDCGLITSNNYQDDCSYILDNTGSEIKIDDKFFNHHNDTSSLIGAEFDHVTFEKYVSCFCFKQNSVENGFLDRKGNISIETVYQESLPFSSGLAGIKLVNSETWNYIDESGKILIKGNYSEVRNFQGDHSIVRENSSSQYILIDREGFKVKTLPFSEIGFYREGYAPAYNTYTGEFSYIDSTGNRIFSMSGHKNLYAEMEFIYTLNFSRGMAPYPLPSNDYCIHLYGFINNMGIKVTQPKYEIVYRFENGLSRVRLNKKYGFIDVYGTEYWED